MTKNMLLSDKLIKLYEDNVKDKKTAPHTMHNLALRFALLILEELGALTPDGVLSIKQADNIWNFVRLELIKKGYDPYTIQENGFTAILKKLAARKIDDIKL